MTIPFNEIPAGNLVPIFAVEINNERASKPGPMPWKNLLIGQATKADNTGKLVRIMDDDQADSLFGNGSQIALMAKNFRKSIESSIHKQGPKVEKLFKFALKVAYEYNQDGYTKGKGWRFILKPLVALFDKILFEKVRQGFGGNIKFFVGGGALLDSELQRFFYAVGMPMLQGYGLSEATPIISANSLGAGRHRFGSSGKVIEPLDLKILDDEGREMPVGVKGEIVIKGENVMAGYWKNPSATAETVKDGWLYTGDMGYMGADGFLYVLGRFKSLLISADGEKYSPEGMEEAIVDKSPLIDQIIIYNNQSPFTSAIVVPNREAMRQILGGKDDEESLRAAAKAIGAEVDKYRTGGQYADEFPDRWLPGALAIVGEAFTEQNGLNEDYNLILISPDAGVMILKETFDSFASVALDTNMSVKEYAKIVMTSNVLEGDPIENWAKHNANMESHCHHLNSLNIEKVHIFADNGTDITVGLIPEGQFCGGGETTKGGLILTSASKEKPEIAEEVSEPALVVITMTAFSKLTFLPCASLTVPSSRICKRILSTSGCAFSISSKRTMEYGRRRIFSVNCPASS